MKSTYTLLYYDVENANGRTYTRAVAESLVEQFNALKEHRAVFGELGQPPRAEVDLYRTSHEVIEVRLNEERQSVECTIRLLNTDAGRVAATALLENENALCVASRGLGDVDPSTQQVQNYRLITIDLVPWTDWSFKEIDKSKT